MAHDNGTWDDFGTDSVAKMTEAPVAVAPAEEKAVQETTPETTDRKIEIETAILKALLPLVSKGGARFNLGGVHIVRRKDGTCYAEATNGHALGRVRFKSEIPSAAFDVILSTEIIKQIIRLSGKHAPLVTMRVTGEDDRRFVEIDGVNGSLRAAPIDGQYPDADKVIPKQKHENTPVPSFDVDLLAKFSDLASLHGYSNQTIVRLVAGDVGDNAKFCPIHVVMKNPDVVGIIMPCRE